MENAPTPTVGPPYQILGYTIRSRTRIWVYYLLPAMMELGVYITQITADCAVSYQHFRNDQIAFAAATLSLVLVPPLLTFVLVLTSKDQWANPKYSNRWQFFGHQLLQMLLFPLFATYRISTRIFWSVEALFHDDDDDERMYCLAKTEECSTCALYRFVQAYGQSAPQIILQLYHMLTQDLFRDFTTTSVQAVSLVFSSIDLAAVTTSYHRFESQHRVGRRHYPWAPPQEIEAERRKLVENERLLLESEMRKRDSERTISSFPESDKIMENFKQRHNRTSTSSQQTMNSVPMGLDEVDIETTVLLHSPSEAAPPPPPPHNATDDDKLHDSPKLRLHTIREELPPLNGIEVLDTVPDTPPPPPQVQPAQGMTNTIGYTSNTNTATRQKRSSQTLTHLETLRDMLIVDAELFIKQHVPRPPKMLTKRVDTLEGEQQSRSTPSTPQPTSSQPTSPQPPLPQPKSPQLISSRSISPLAASPRATSIQSSSPPPYSPAPGCKDCDTVDFFFPRPTKVVSGIEQDDFAGKTVSFFGWITYLIMRMLALSMFLVFYTQAFFIVIGVQYVITLFALFMESRFKGVLNKVLFYMLLAYVYIFVLLEFRVKFKHIRVWYLLYFVFCAMGENITMTVIWYTEMQEDVTSWWFQFIFECIIWSAVIFVASILVYYFILRPKEVTLILEDDENGNENPTANV